MMWLLQYFEILEEEEEWSDAFFSSENGELSG